MTLGSRSTVSSPVASVGLLCAGWAGVLTPPPMQGLLDSTLLWSESLDAVLPGLVSGAREGLLLLPDAGD